jgi:hypothetical protein
MKRIIDWKQHLTTLINERRTAPFQWGTHDCALWAADCVLAITGEDFAKDARGTYESAIGAIKCLSKIYQADNLKEVFSSRFEEVHIALARPGDIVYRASNYEGFNVAIGVCYGANSFFLIDGENSLVMLPTLTLDGAFRIA